MSVAFYYALKFYRRNEEEVMMNKYEIVFKDGFAIVVEGEVFVFNDECTGVIESDVAISVNVKDILYIKKLNNE